MKKILRITIGSIIAFAGVALIYIGGKHTLAGDLIWIPIVLVGLAISFTDIELIRGERVRDVLKSLVSILMRWTP